MAEVAEYPDVEQGTKKTIYWPHPEFTNEGTVNTTKMVDFLIHDVPNNHFRKKMLNTWNSGEEFEVHFPDAEKKEIVIFRCKLEITGTKKNHSVECTMCEPKNAIASNRALRAEEVARVISGRQN